MAEPTNPQAGVATEPTATPEQRLVAFYARQQGKPAPEAVAEPEPPTEAPPEEAAPEPEGQADSEEPTADDLILEDEAATAPAQPTADEFELIHNGQNLKFGREEVIKLAQQGFDYTRKSEANAAKERQLTEALQTAEEVVQLQAALSDDLAQVKGFERALAQYQNVDWVAIATTDPGEYAKHRAHYDQLVSGYNAAVNGVKQKSESIAQGRQKAAATLLQAETGKMRELIPEWRDDARFSAEAKQVAEYGIKEGYSSAEMNSIRDARMVRTLRKAMLYDKLVAAKADKLKQVRAAPPTTKPGALGTTQTAEQARTVKMRQQLKKTGDWRDAAALLSRAK